MRWLNIMMGVVMAILVALSSVEAAEVDGFRGLRWGTRLETLNSTEFVRVPSFKGIAPGTESYRRTGDELVVAGMPVEQINYNFRKGELISVNIDFRAFYTHERFLSYCKELFGPPTASMIKNMEYFTTFESPRTGALLYLQLTTPIYSDGKLFLYSRESMD